MFDRVGIAGSFTFCLDEPDRGPAFTAANDRTLAYAAEQPGSDRSFRSARPRGEPGRGSDPLPRPRRARDQAPPARTEVLGGRRATRPGLRARGRARRPDPHPRRSRPASDRRPPRGARRPLRRRSPDHRPRRHRRPRRPRRPLRRTSPGVFFDTSLWSIVDLLDLMRQVAPQQILFATDYPYGRLPNQLLLALRAARARQLRRSRDPRDARRHRSGDQERRHRSPRSPRPRALT